MQPTTMACSSEQVLESGVPEGTPKVSSSSGDSPVFEELTGWEVAYQRAHNSAAAAAVAIAIAAATEVDTTDIVGRVASS